MGSKFAEKSITVAAVGIGHLVYLGKIRARTSRAQSIQGNGPALLRRRFAVILFVHSTCAITHVDFSLRMLSLQLADPTELLEHVEISRRRNTRNLFPNVISCSILCTPFSPHCNCNCKRLDSLYEIV